MEFTIFRKDYHPLLVESLVKVMLLYFEKRKQLSRVQLPIKKVLKKKFFGRTPKGVGKVCLKFPSQCRQASFLNSTGSLLQVIVNIDGMWIDVTIGEDYRVNLPTVCLFPDTVTRHRAVQMLNKEKLGGCLARAGAEPPR